MPHSSSPPAITAVSSSATMAAAPHPHEGATFNLSYITHLLGASLYFWCSATNNFHFPYGMMSLTLMDISTLTGLLLNGEFVSWSIDYPEDDFNINFNSNSISSFIQNNMGSNGDSISDSEHICYMLLPKPPFNVPSSEAGDLDFDDISFDLENIINSSSSTKLFSFSCKSFSI
ncbi:hypothetical protein Ahy_B01g053053 [Arachis hypogaea]|uniref:Aminotransferase-like plant mobile domain-containing protein n=1 Tax=Arachis hypogaea TaxID=3818 RepID=A0A445AQZ8_ARAHY|nr:hypothetical protein Ahy_B01g053053 [Arachis hypogaea]